MTDNMLAIAAAGCLIIVILGGMVSLFMWRYRNAKKLLTTQTNAASTERLAMSARITELERGAALINASVMPISAAFQAVLVKELIHYHTAEIDDLINKVGVLTTIETKRLETLLKQRTKEMGELINPIERDAATILPIVMKRAARTSTLSVPSTASIQLVMVPNPNIEEPVVVPTAQAKKVIAKVDTAAVQKVLAPIADPPAPEIKSNRRKPRGK